MWIEGALAWMQCFVALQITESPISKVIVDLTLQDDVLEPTAGVLGLSCSCLVCHWRSSEHFTPKICHFGILIILRVKYLGKNNINHSKCWRSFSLNSLYLPEDRSSKSFAGLHPCSPLLKWYLILNPKPPQGATHFSAGISHIYIEVYTLISFCFSFVNVFFYYRGFS